jgi:putative transposase
VASAVNSEGFREILGICEGAKEDKSGWSAFLRHLVDRGLKGVQLIISDVCRGLVESVAEYLPEARWQRCMVHFYRNVFSHVPATKVREVSHMLKAIHAQESRDAADKKAKTIIDELRASKMSKAADLVEQAVHETLTYYAFPDIHWQKIRTNNPLERIMREIRRRTRVCWRISGRPVLSQPGCSSTALHRRNDMVNQALHEHAATLCAAVF